MKYLVTLMLLLVSSFACAQDPPAPALELTVEHDTYELKDNVMIVVLNGDDNLRLKVFGPELNTFQTYRLAEGSKFFFQATKPGKYLIEASDSDEDITSKIEVVGKLPDLPEVPKSEVGLDIYEKLIDINYPGMEKDCLEMAKIFKKNRSKEPSQALINATFTDLSAYLKNNPNKDKWKQFFPFLQKYYEDLKIPTIEISKYRTLWDNTQEAFECRGK